MMMIWLLVCPSYELLYLQSQNQATMLASLASPAAGQERPGWWADTTGLAGSRYTPGRVNRPL